MIFVLTKTRHGSNSTLMLLRVELRPSDVFWNMSRLLMTVIWMFVRYTWNVIDSVSRLRRRRSFIIMNVTCMHCRVCEISKSIDTACFYQCTNYVFDCLLKWCIPLITFFIVHAMPECDCGTDAWYAEPCTSTVSFVNALVTTLSCELLVECFRIFLNVYCKCFDLLILLVGFELIEWFFTLFFSLLAVMSFSLVLAVQRLSECVFPRFWFLLLQLRAIA